MPLLGKKYSEYCLQPAQTCDGHPDCDHCPEAKEAEKLKRKALEAREEEAKED